MPARYTRVAGGIRQARPGGAGGRTGDVFYRIRVCQAVRENLPVFHEYFRTRLLPVQVRHGARLVGRWEAGDGRGDSHLGVRRPGSL